MTNLFIPTYLYVKTHNVTGLKYFGKTIKDPNTYKGSGKWWKNHIQKYGYNVSTEIIGYYTIEEECINAALHFSKQNNIVESTEWANLMPENGINGGLQYNSGEYFKLINTKPKTASQKHKQSAKVSGPGNGMFGKHHSNETKLLQSKQQKNKPKPLVICRLCDRKEMSATGFSLYIRKYLPKQVL